jgi:5-(carboxyamino)imidazole ribonucleotide mutase
LQNSTKQMKKSHQTKSNRMALSNGTHQPLVGIIMGSDSDLETMREAALVLDEFGIAFEMKIVSAHRTPDDMANYAKSARKRGLKVIIAGAGGAAHLPGMTASHTTLPVIGVPVMSRSLLGVDSLYSIVQMPAGIPVATVAIGNAKNAGLLAAQILATSNTALAEQLDAYRKKLAAESRKKNQKIIGDATNGATTI